MAEMLKDQEQILKNGFDLMQHLHKVRLTTETVIIYGVALDPLLRMKKLMKWEGVFEYGICNIE